MTFLMYASAAFIGALLVIIFLVVGIPAVLEWVKGGGQ